MRSQPAEQDGHYEAAAARGTVPPFPGALGSRGGCLPSQLPALPPGAAGAQAASGIAGLGGNPRILGVRPAAGLGCHLPHRDGRNKAQQLSSSLDLAGLSPRLGSAPGLSWAGLST